MLRPRHSTGFCHCCLWVTPGKPWEPTGATAQGQSQGEHLALPLFRLLTLGSCTLFRSVWPSDSFRSTTFYIASYRLREFRHSGNGTQTSLCLGSKWLLQTFSIRTHGEGGQYSIVRRTVRVTSSIVHQSRSCAH